jgi:hypothetical protein
VTISNCNYAAKQAKSWAASQSILGCFSIVQCLLCVVLYQRSSFGRLYRLLCGVVDLEGLFVLGPTLVFVVRWKQASSCQVLVSLPSALCLIAIFPPVNFRAQGRMGLVGWGLQNWLLAATLYDLGLLVHINRGFRPLFSESQLFCATEDGFRFKAAMDIKDPSWACLVL